MVTLRTQNIERAVKTIRMKRGQKKKQKTF